MFPVTLSIYVLIAACTKAESFFGQLIKQLLSPSLYFPGLGIILTILLIILVGILVSNFITGSIIRAIMNQFERVPLLKVIYNPLKDLISMFSSSDSANSGKKVVLVNLDKMGVQALGLVTREEFSDFPEGTFGDDSVVVYIPMSYMLGGFTTVVARSSIQEVDIPVEQAIKLAITGWVKADKDAF